LDAGGDDEFEREPKQKDESAVGLVEGGDVKAGGGQEEADAAGQGQDLGGDKQPSQEETEVQAESPDQKDDQNGEPKIE